MDGCMSTLKLKREKKRYEIKKSDLVPWRPQV